MKCAYIVNSNEKRFPIGMNNLRFLDSRFSNQNLISYLRSEIKSNQGFIMFECNSLMDTYYKCIENYNTEIQIKSNQQFDSNNL